MRHNATPVYSASMDLPRRSPPVQARFIFALRSLGTSAQALCAVV